MAVYTNVPDSELTAFLSQYDIGSALSLKGIAEGVENSNFLLDTTKGRFILTLFEKRVDRDDLPYFLELMSFCADKGLPVAPVIKKKTGDLIGDLCGRPAAIITFLSGLSVDLPSALHCAATGDMLARLHKATADFPMTRENPLSLEGWLDLRDQTVQDADRCAAGLSDLINEECAFLRENWPTDLPRGVTHSDLFPDNVLFTGTDISGVIDFYFSANDFLAYDLAVLINAWCFDGDHKLDKVCAKALVEQYDSRRPLTTAETLALPILMRGAALRFLLTRLYDWLHQSADALVTVKNPLEYQVKLQQHRSLETLADYLV